MFWHFQGPLEEEVILGVTVVSPSSRQPCEEMKLFYWALSFSVFSGMNNEENMEFVICFW